MSQDRRTSFGGMLLRRSKSGDLRGKKAQALREQELQRQRNTIPKSPPRLPDLYNGSPVQGFQSSFDHDVRPDHAAILASRFEATPRTSIDPGRSIVSVPPPPPIPQFDPYARTESITNRGRYSYASSLVSTINSPRRVRRRKDPTPFNVLIIGSKNSGKTSLLEFLKSSLALPAKKRARTAAIDDDLAQRQARPEGNFIPHFLETEIDNERIGLTIWDSEGLERNIVDLQLREMAAFLEGKFEETFTEEQKVIRSPGVQDSHIHAVLLILDPSRLDRNIASSKFLSSSGRIGKHAPIALDEDLDLQVLRTLQGKTTVIPVIAKADTITTTHMTILKNAVWDSLKASNLDPLEALGLDDEDSGIDTSRIDEEDEEEEEDLDEEEEREHSDDDAFVQSDTDELPIQTQTQGQSSSTTKRPATTSTTTTTKSRSVDTKPEDIPFIPMSVISPDLYEPAIQGRQFPWGFADPNDEKHCDFRRLKDTVFSEWRAELREASREQWYEQWRTSRLKTRDGPRGTVRHL